MAITYDFDMFSVIPKEVQAKFGGMLAELGMTDKMAEQIALFRDPAAVAALQGASDAVKQCLKDSGFGINIYDSGAGAGRYPASDGPARAVVIERLMENLEKLPDDVDWNGFDIEAFAMAALTAKPLDAPRNAPGEMRTAAKAAEPQATAPASSMDDFFSGSPKARSAAPQAAAPDMDAFFSGSPKAAARAPQEAAPDMDAFFSNTGGGRAMAATTPRMTADDIRMSIDTAPPKKVGIGPVKMVLMALGLFVMVSVLGNGTGAGKLVEIATGGKMVAIGQ